MKLEILANSDAIKYAINRFSNQYHTDYYETRILSDKYIDNLNDRNINALTEKLIKTLSNWGAGSRAAASLAAPNVIRSMLTTKEAHEVLSFIKNNPISSLEYSTKLVNKNMLHESLSLLSSSIFVRNKNVTYPMKALLLLTGFMPALDSQVRKGLDMANFSGINATQFLLSQNPEEASSKKLFRLSEILSDCYHENSAVLNSAITASNHNQLNKHIGRLFDILLFMQVSNGLKLLALPNRNKKWYQ